MIYKTLHRKLKDRVTRTPQNTESEVVFSGRVSSSGSTSDPPSCYSSYKIGNKSWKRKVPVSVYDKWNISVVICDTDIL